MGSVKKSRASDSRKPSTKTARGRHTENSPSQGRHSRLRCPFHAKRPDKFRGFNSSCQGNGFETNARVVEHLKRTHGPIEHSNGIVGAKASVLQSPPQTADDEEHERVTKEQLDLIADLPRNSNVEKKWDMIYKVIFPGEEDVKPAYMPSFERLRDHARNPPEWLLADLTGTIGASRQEILSMMQNFLVFVDIIGGGPSSLLASSAEPQPTGGSEMDLEHSSVDDVNDLNDKNDKSETGLRDLHGGTPFGNHRFETLSPAHDYRTGKRITDGLG